MFGDPQVCLQWCNDVTLQESLQHTVAGSLGATLDGTTLFLVCWPDCASRWPPPPLPLPLPSSQARSRLQGLCQWRWDHFDIVWGPVVQWLASAELLERKVAGSMIPTTGDFHTVGPCKKAVFACLATDVKQDTFTNSSPSAPAHLVRLISFCSFRPDEDQGNPGRNVVSFKKCAGAEGEELVLSWPSKRDPVQDTFTFLPFPSSREGLGLWCPLQVRRHSLWSSTVKLQSGLFAPFGRRGAWCVIRVSAFVVVATKKWRRIDNENGDDPSEAAAVPSVRSFRLADADDSRQRSHRQAFAEEEK